MAGKQVQKDGCLYIQFARAPQAGRVKTRMQPYLGPVEACELHCELLAYSAMQLQRLSASPRELWIAGDPAHPWLSRIAAHYGMGLCPQRGSDLGERMLHALRDGLSRYRRVVLVGSDCPGLDPDYLEEAALRLRHHDMVWGPAVDGGYVLVGARRAHAACFRDIDWGRAAVMAQTLARAREGAVSHALLPVREDIDRPGDLPLWLSIRGRQAVAEPGSADTQGLLAQGLRLCAGGD
ncbi:MAG: TIGR04282 family arsenosugar biosynthesis glycosyltransferase [Chromatocurvus sp.]